MNSIRKYINLGSNVFKTVFCCYHEIWHSVQDKFDAYSYEGFLRDTEKFLIASNGYDYKTEHNKYSLEIGANMYSITQSAEYLKRVP